MNCQDLALLLDDGDIGRLDPQVRRAADAHAGTCPDCATDWQLHARLADKALPSMPPGLAASCRALAAAPPRGRHARGRLVVVGSIVTLAAAAALLAFYFTQAPEAVGETAADVPLADPEPVTTAPVAVAPAEPEATPEPKDSPAPPAATPPARFTVRVVELKNEATSAAGKLAIDTFNNAVIEQLRDIPGLVLLTPEDAGRTAGVEPDFTLSSHGTGPQAGKEYAGTLKVEMFKAGKNVGMTAISFGACDTAAPSGPDCDPVSQAARMVQKLRSMSFPTDPAIVQQQIAALADKARSPAERMQALEDIRVSRNVLGAIPGTSTLEDPAVVRAAAELAGSADPALRVRVWRIMGEAHNAALIPPLLGATRDEDGLVRIAAVTALGLRHARDPSVRAALEGIARDDNRHLVRAIAARAVDGEEGWKQYVGESIRDTSRTDEERVEALLYHFENLRSDPRKFLQEVLKDDQTIRALAETLPKWQHRRNEGRGDLLNTLATVVQSIEHPAIGAMVVEGLQKEGPKGDWLYAADSLLKKGPDDRVQAALEKIAASDPDATSRAGAAGVLKGLTGRTAAPAP